MGTAQGWILDVRRNHSGVTVWVKTTRGEVERFTRRIRPSFFLYGKGVNLPLLGSMLTRRGAETRVVEVMDFFSGDAVSALKVVAPTPAAFSVLVRCAARMAGEENIYSCDIPVEQLFFYETNTFPLCRSRFGTGAEGELLEVEPLEGDWDLEYELPPLSVMCVRPLPEERVNPSHAPWASLELLCEGMAYELEWCEDEAFLSQINGFTRDFEPDVVISEWGDEYIFPRLFELSRKTGVPLAFSRDTGEGAPTPVRGGRSFFSYGTMVYRANAAGFPGRPHVDVANSFFWGEVGLDGILQLARISKIPLERLSRASPGTVISAMEVERAWRRGIPVPYRKRQTEFFKSAEELVVTDKGGLVYVPPVGVFENVCELDFASMYPSLMVKYNISPETLLCDCCKERMVPETGTHTCSRRKGLIPEVLEPVLLRRKRYRDMRGKAEGGGREVYDSRQKALKWILVVCFGFLGYKNARFGRIEAHEAVTAYGREKLLAAKEIAERKGYRFIHGLTDALWVRREGASEDDYRGLARTISEETGLEISVEGLYRWVAFLPSRKDSRIAVPGRFVGIFKGGERKARGISSRRRDTPPFIRRMQEEILEKASEFESLGELRKKGQTLRDIYHSRLEELESGTVSPWDLSICRRLSKPPGMYRENTAVAQVVRELSGRGVELKPGEVVWYVITGEGKPGEGEKARALGFFAPEHSIDLERYVRMAGDAAEELLQILELPVRPFD